MMGIKTTIPEVSVDFPQDINTHQDVSDRLYE
jgi:hypothetical protein